MILYNEQTSASSLPVIQVMYLIYLALQHSNFLLILASIRMLFNTGELAEYLHLHLRPVHYWLSFGLIKRDQKLR